MIAPASYSLAGTAKQICRQAEATKGGSFAKGGFVRGFEEISHQIFTGSI